MFAPQPKRRIVNDIYSSGQHLLSLINDILDLTQGVSPLHGAPTCTVFMSPRRSTLLHVILEPPIEPSRLRGDIEPGIDI